MVDVKQQQPLIRNLLKFKSYLFSAPVLFKIPYLGVDPLDSIRVMLSPAVEMHGTHVLWTSLLPGVAIAQPIVSLLHLDNDINLYQGQLLRGGGRQGVTTRCVCVEALSSQEGREISGHYSDKGQTATYLRADVTNLPAVDNLLIEDAELVADAVAVGSQAQRSHGVQETG